MNPANSTDLLAVCSWSLLPKDPHDLLAKLKSTGVGQVQLELDPLRDQPDTWAGAPELLRENGIKIVSGMFKCVGEDYSTLESIRLTGGIAPDSTWRENLENMHGAASVAQRLGIKLVTFHAGFLPDEETDPAFAKMLQRLTQVADLFAECGISVGLETGQETAPSLAHLLRRLDINNLGVNFDPANMILYGKGDPVDALRVLAPWIRQVHIKDAKRTAIPGTWGEEVVAGTGDVDWPAFFTAVKQLDPLPRLAIEREAGDRRIDDIRAARVMVEKAFG